MVYGPKGLRIRSCWPSQLVIAHIIFVYSLLYLFFLLLILLLPASHQQEGPPNTHKAGPAQSFLFKGSFSLTPNRARGTFDCKRCCITKDEVKWRTDTSCHTTELVAFSNTLKWFVTWSCCGLQIGFIFKFSSSYIVLVFSVLPGTSEKAADLFTRLT